MGERSRSFLQSRFQTGAHPNQSDFGDLIDSPINWEDVGTAVRVLASAETTAQARSRLGISGVTANTVLDDVGNVSATSPSNGDMLVWVSASSEWGRLPTGPVGRLILAHEATASARLEIGGNIVNADSTVAARNNFGFGTVGAQVIGVSATSSLKDIIGVGGPTLEIDVDTVSDTTTVSTVHGLGAVNYITAFISCYATTGDLLPGQRLYSLLELKWSTYTSGDSFYLTRSVGSMVAASPQDGNLTIIDGSDTVKLKARAYSI